MAHNHEFSAMSQMLLMEFSRFSLMIRPLGHAFNIGGEEEISMKSLAERVIAVTGSSSTIEFVPYSKAYPAGFEETMRRVPDTTKLRTTTGWKPQYSLDDIIHDIEKYLRNNS